MINPVQLVNISGSNVQLHSFQDKDIDKFEEIMSSVLSTYSKMLHGDIRVTSADQFYIPKHIIPSQYP